MRLYPELVNKHPYNASYRNDLAAVCYNIGIQYQASRQLQEAVAAYREAITLREKLAADFPTSPDYLHKLGGVLNNLANVLAAQGQFALAGRALEEAIRRQQAAVKLNPRHPDYRVFLRNHYHNLGDTLEQRKLYEGAAKAFAEAIVLAEKLAAEFPGEPSHQTTLANHWDRLFRVHAQAGQVPAALAACRKCSVVWAKLAGDHAAVVRYREELATTLFNLGLLQVRAGDPREGAASMRRAVATQEKVIDDQVRTADGASWISPRQTLVTFLTRLAVLQVKASPKEAEKLFRRAVAVQEQLVGRGPSAPDGTAARHELGACLYRLGVFLMETRRPAAAEKTCRQALEVQRKLVAEHPREPDYRRACANTLNFLSVLLSRQDRIDDAELLLRQAIKHQQRLVADFPDRPDYESELGVKLSNLAILWRDRRKAPDRARPLIEEAIRHQRAALKRQPKQPAYQDRLADHYGCLADILVKLGQHAAAAQAAEGLAAVFPKDFRDCYGAACYLAMCATLVEKDGKLSPEKRKELAQTYGKRGVQLLREAMKRGYRAINQLKKDPELNPLRARADFGQLVRELEEKVRAKGRE